MKVDVYHNPYKPAHRLVLPAGAEVADQIEDFSSGVQLMLPPFPYVSNIELGTIAAGRLHVSLRDALLQHGRAFVPTEAYALHHRAKVDLYASASTPQFWLAIFAGRSLAPLIADTATGVASMLPLTQVGTNVLLAAACRPAWLNTVFAQIEMIGGAIIDAGTLKQLPSQPEQDYSGG